MFNRQPFIQQELKKHNIPSYLTQLLKDHFEFTDSVMSGIYSDVNEIAINAKNREFFNHRSEFVKGNSYKFNTNISLNPYTDFDKNIVSLPFNDMYNTSVEKYRIGILVFINGVLLRESAYSISLNNSINVEIDRDIFMSADSNQLKVRIDLFGVRKFGMNSSRDFHTGGGKNTTSIPNPRVVLTEDVRPGDVVDLSPYSSFTLNHLSNQFLCAYIKRPNDRHFRVLPISFYDIIRDVNNNSVKLFLKETKDNIDITIPLGSVIMLVSKVDYWDYSFTMNTDDDTEQSLLFDGDRMFPIAIEDPMDIYVFCDGRLLNGNEYMILYPDDKSDTPASLKINGWDSSMGTKHIRVIKSLPYLPNLYLDLYQEKTTNKKGVVDYNNPDIPPNGNFPILFSGSYFDSIGLYDKERKSLLYQTLYGHVKDGDVHKVIRVNAKDANYIRISDRFICSEHEYKVLYENSQSNDEFDVIRSILSEETLKDEFSKLMLELPDIEDDIVDGVLISKDRTNIDTNTMNMINVLEGVVFELDATGHKAAIDSKYHNAMLALLQQSGSKDNVISIQSGDSGQRVELNDASDDPSVSIEKEIFE